MNVIESAEGKGWTVWHGDCVEVTSNLPDASVGYTIFSPPFASLYTYSDSPRDMGNTATHDEFYRHFSFLVPQLLRVTKPGRLLSFHCMNLPTSKARDGYIGLSDFRGILIRAFQDAGWIYHSEVCIWTDPVTAMQRTKALGLLHKQIKKDSAMSRQGIPDYLVTMRKPGENPEPVTHTNETFPVELWQRYASPIWVTTRGVDSEGFAVCTGEDDGTDSGSVERGDTLTAREARDERDERHLCCLQLPVIRRAIRLWTNPNDVVFSPFGGVGSEPYTAIEEGRRAIACELKGSYFRQMVKNLRSIEKSSGQPDLFSAMGG
jgi:DNA modification methylase